jgi:hypothetical protein
MAERPNHLFCSFSQHFRSFRDNFRSCNADAGPPQKYRFSFYFALPKSAIFAQKVAAHDDKDTIPKSSARSGSSSSPSVPGGNSFMMRGSSKKTSIAITAASEVPLSVPP